MNFDDDFEEDDGVVHNVNLLFGSYINFIVGDNDFILEFNDEGRESFIDVLNRLLYKSNCYVRLTGFQYTDSYTLTTECFFEEKSDDLELSKNDTNGSNTYYEDLGLYPYGGEKQVGLEMSSNTILKIKEDISNMINLKRRIIEYNVIGKETLRIKKFIITLVDKISPRMKDGNQY